MIADFPVPPPPSALGDPQRLPGLFSRYRAPSPARAVMEIAVTLIPLMALWAAMWGLSFVSYALSLVLALPAAGFLLRVFMIQHDCGHGSFFRTRAVNDWVGRLLGVLTFTPYDYWKRSHAAHHAGSGNLDRRGQGDIDTLTVAEYLAKDRRGRLAYRLYRHPLVMFGIGPSYMFLIQQRLPLGFLIGAGWKPWLSPMLTNLGIAIVVALLVWLVGPWTFLMIHAPIFVMSATVGIWLFYVQHQFEGAHWDRDVDWSLPESALQNSSHYDLPIVLRWFTANIGLHHVHHLASRIPFYRLREVLRDFPELGQVGRLTLRESFKCLHFALWDEDAQEMISFAALRARSPA